MQQVTIDFVGLQALKRDGSVRAVLGEMQTRKDLYELIRYVPGEQWNYPAG